MKVGTDAVLLGAWADVQNVKTILDIGTGSGVIALMLAQRTNENVTIDAIESAKGDSQQAYKNMLASPWYEKISVITVALQEFHPKKKYDLIVCNPPFFTKSLLPPAKDRTNVRHDTQLTFDELIESAIELLSAQGRLCVILPPVEAEAFSAKAQAMNVYLSHQTRFFTREGKPQERSLLQFSLTSKVPKSDSLLLYQSGNQWSENYSKLTSDFYLDRVLPPEGKSIA
ncbi:tRNA1(Val) (adenine(37)-N6)-methyltransferase [soil metagenome]